MASFGRSAVFCSIAIATAVVAACALPSRDEFAIAMSDSGVGPGGDGSNASDSLAPFAPQHDGDADGFAGDGGGTGDDGGAIINLIQSDKSTFENGGCESHSGYNAYPPESSKDSHQGSASCLFCWKDRNTPIYTLDFNFMEGPKPGEVYRARAWVKSLGPGQAYGQEMSIHLRTHIDDPFTDVEVGSSPVTILNDQWQLLETTLTVTKPGIPWLDVYVLSEPNADADRCFLVDDLIVWRPN